MKSTRCLFFMTYVFLLSTACAAPATPEPTVAPTITPSPTIAPTATWTPAPTPTETVIPTPTTDSSLVTLPGGLQVKKGSQNLDGSFNIPADGFVTPPEVVAMGEAEVARWQSQWNVVPNSKWEITPDNKLIEVNGWADLRMTKSGEGYASWDWEKDEVKTAILSQFAKAPKGTIGANGLTQDLGKNYSDTLNEFANDSFSAYFDTSDYHLEAVILARPNKNTNIMENVLMMLATNVKYSSVKEMESIKMSGVLLSTDNSGMPIAININNFTKLFIYAVPAVPVKN